MSELRRDKGLLLIMTPPIFKTASPHLFDNSAETYALDYSLGGKQQEAIVAVGYCPVCKKRYVVAAQPAGWAIMNYESKAQLLLAMESTDKPICVEPRFIGMNVELEWQSIASIVTSEGQWLHLHGAGMG